MRGGMRGGWRAELVSVAKGLVRQWHFCATFKENAQYYLRFTKPFATDAKSGGWGGSSFGERGGRRLTEPIRATDRQN